MEQGTLGLIVGATVVMILLAVGGMINAQLRTSIDPTNTNNTAANITRSGDSFLTSFSSLTPTYGTVLIAAALVAAVIGGLAFLGGRRQ